MNLLGDLERVFATGLYPLRVPIAIGFAASIVLLAIAARRGGWFAAARRHPRRAAGLGLAVLAFGLPVAFYLGSPLFIRTELNEPPPLAVALATDTAAPPSARPIATASTSPVLGVASTPLTPPAPAEPTPFLPILHAMGPFIGADEFHFGEGTASIIETSPGSYTLRFDDFSVRNGPDLYVYLSPDAAGYASGVLELGTLKATDGAFGYQLPAGSEPTDFASAVIWCKQFAVQFAVARLDAV